METANSAMRKIWITLKEANGQLITIDRDYLYTLFLKVEKENFDTGYDLGFEHRSSLEYERLPISIKTQKDCVEW